MRTGGRSHYEVTLTSHQMLRVPGVVGHLLQEGSGFS